MFNADGPDKTFAHEVAFLEERCCDREVGEDEDEIIPLVQTFLRNHTRSAEHKQAEQSIKDVLGIG